jgi:predicted nuclease of predicted toxin-antitoxin system
VKLQLPFKGATLLVDENVPRRVREWLRENGFDITNVSETPLKRSKDHTIAKYATENNMVILTLDLDFAQIYHTLKKGTLSVIVIRANPATAFNILETLIIGHQKINLHETKNKLIIITKKKIRIIT